MAKTSTTNFEILLGDANGKDKTKHTVKVTYTTNKFYSIMEDQHIRVAVALENLVCDHGHIPSSQFKNYTLSGVKCGHEDCRASDFSNVNLSPEILNDNVWGFSEGAVNTIFHHISHGTDLAGAYVQSIEIE